MAPYQPLTAANAVQKALKPFTSPQAALLRSLLDSNKNGPMKTRSTAVKKGFGPNDSDFPALSKRLCPFRQLPTAEELEGILVQDLQSRGEDESEKGSVIYFPPGEEKDADQIAALELISNVSNKSHTVDGYIPNLQSPTLEEMCVSNKEIPPTSIFELPTSCTILPAGHAIELQHQNESTAFVTLMGGKIVWMIWPPTEHNLSTLQGAYEAYAEDFDPSKLDVAPELVGGVAFVQQFEEGLRLPPFCLLMGLVTETAVMARYATVTVKSFIDMCKNLTLYKAWWKTEANPEQTQSAFAESLVDCFTLILEGKFDRLDVMNLKYPITQAGALLSVINAWDEIKTEVLGVMDAETRSAMKKVWMEFVESSKTMKCLICGQRWWRETRRHLDRHFEEKHWVEVKDVDSAELNPDESRMDLN